MSAELVQLTIGLLNSLTEGAMPLVPRILVLNVHGFFLVFHLLEIVVSLTVSNIHTA